MTKSPPLIIFQKVCVFPRAIKILKSYWTSHLKLLLMKGHTDVIWMELQRFCAPKIAEKIRLKRKSSSGLIWLRKLRKIVNILQTKSQSYIKEYLIPTKFSYTGNLLMLRKWSFKNSNVPHNGLGVNPLTTNVPII